MFRSIGQTPINFAVPTFRDANTYSSIARYASSRAPQTLERHHIFTEDLLAVPSGQCGRTNLPRPAVWL
jgi:hypothetical protein